MTTSERKVPPYEFFELDSFKQAEEVIADALAYSGIDSKTAPVRYAAAEKAAVYATYVAMGITGHIPLRQTAREYLDETWQPRLDEVDAISEFESQRDQLRLTEEE